MRHWSFVGFSAACLLCGCAGAVHQLPEIDPADLTLAQAEVRAAGGAPLRRDVSDEEARTIVRSAASRLLAPASQLCREMNVGACEWKFRLSPDRAMNAGAWPLGFIVVNRGIVEYAANEEEVCLVIAHEIGHQAANHVQNSLRNQAAGAVLGSLVAGAAGALASSGSYNRDDVTLAVARSGADIGAAIGRLSYSKEQEREADYLAAMILYRAGVDLDKARGFLVKMAHASGRSQTGLLDTHPAGPERIARWDSAVQQIRASNGQLPQRKS